MKIDLTAKSADAIEQPVFQRSTASLGTKSRDEGSPDIPLLRQQLEDELRATRFARRARRLALSMLPHLTVCPEGKELLIWMGGSDVRDNLSALQHWVQEQLGDPSFDLTCGAGPELSELLIRLERHCLWHDAANDEHWG